MTHRAPPAPGEGISLSVTNYTHFRQILPLSNMHKLPCLVPTNNVNLFVWCLHVGKEELIGSCFSLLIHVTPFIGFGNPILGLVHVRHVICPESHPTDLPKFYQLKKTMELMQYGFKPHIYVFWSQTLRIWLQGFLASAPLYVRMDHSFFWGTVLSPVRWLAASPTSAY